MKRALPLIALVLAGCGFEPAKLFESSSPVEVREVARSLYCNTPGDAAQAQLLNGAQAVVDWQSARGIALAGSESLAQAPYAVIEMGARPTGGYGLAVARAAKLRGEQLTVQATFVSPAPGSLRTQALSSPCVLLQLPAGRYSTIEVQDPAGAVRATGTHDMPLQPPPPAPTETAAPAAPAETPAPAPAETPGQAPATPPADAPEQAPADKPADDRIKWQPPAPEAGAPAT